MKEKIHAEDINGMHTRKITSWRANWKANVERVKTKEYLRNQ